MFEILTLAQTHKLAKKITVVIYGTEYWKRVFNIETLVETGAISPKDLDLIEFADTPEQAFEILKRGLTENYLLPEAQAAASASSPSDTAGPSDPRREQDLMAGWSFDDFLSPELAKTRR